MEEDLIKAAVRRRMIEEVVGMLAELDAAPQISEDLYQRVRGLLLGLYPEAAPRVR